MAVVTKKRVGLLAAVTAILFFWKKKKGGAGQAVGLLGVVQGRRAVSLREGQLHQKVLGEIEGVGEMATGLGTARSLLDPQPTACSRACSTIVVAIDPTPAVGGAGAGWRLMANVDPPAAENIPHRYRRQHGRQP